MTTWRPSPERSEENFLDECYPRLRAYATSIADADLDPDDLVHEAITSTLEHHRITDLEHPEAYLRRCIFNAAANHRRRQGRMRRAIGRLVSDDAREDQYPSDLGLLDELSPTDRAVIEMGDIDGTPHAVIADELGLSPGAVRKRAMRARTRLRYVVAVTLTVVLALLLVPRLGDERGLETVDDGETTDDSTSTDSELPGMEWPSRYLIDGLELTAIHEPHDGEYNSVSVTLGKATPQQPPIMPGDHVSVFAHADDPYEHPVFVVTRSIDTAGAVTGSSKRTFNTTTENAGPTIDDVVLATAVPRVIDGSNYELAAEWEEPAAWPLGTWQFDFGDDAAWQVVDHDGAGEWFWITRLAGTLTERLEPIEVAGHSGVLVTSSVGGGQGIVWTEGDVVHRLVAGGGAEASASDTSALAARVYAATDAEWAAAQPADGWFSNDSVALLPVAVVGLVILAVGLLQRRR